MAPSSQRLLPLTVTRNFLSLLPPKRSCSKRGIFLRTAAERFDSWLSLMVNSFSFSKPLKASSCSSCNLVRVKSSCSKHPRPVKRLGGKRINVLFAKERRCRLQPIELKAFGSMDVMFFPARFTLAEDGSK
eukprot:Skav210037  [mRNA]  locus=scaffold706:113528:114312:- [translate_table: standard]